MRANGHILIVEEEPANAMLIENRLGELGYSVAGIAGSGKDALRLAKEHRPDLVLMNLELENAVSRARGESCVRRERNCFATALAWVSDAVLAADPTGVVQFLNPAAERLTGWSVSDAQGRDIDEVFQAFEPVNGARVASEISQLLATGCAASTVGLRLLASRYGWETLIEQTDVCITSDLGEVTGVLVIFREHRL